MAYGLFSLIIYYE